MELNFAYILNYFCSFNSNRLIILLLVIVINSVYSSIIQIPFNILKSQSINQNKTEEESIKDMKFFIKLISSVEIGKPLQKIETIFDLRESSYYISNYCYNCSYIYLYNKSSTFSKAQTDEIPKGLFKSFYALETFYFYDGKNNKKKEVKDMLLYFPEVYNLNKSLHIGLKFPDNINNDYQESFIQQLKHKNIINKYFWTMIFNNNKDKNNNDNNYYNYKINEEYDGVFIFGDVLNDFYSNFKNYSSNKLFHAYTGYKKKKINLNSNPGLLWGLLFDEVYYELKNDNSYINSNNQNSNIVNINNLVSEFDFNLNSIYGTYLYSRNIQKDYFKMYLNKNICQSTFMKGSYYKYIYCDAKQFTKEDLKKFPTLYFKNIELNYIFSLDYNDLFYLSKDNNYYIFNILIIDIFNVDGMDYDEIDVATWIFGLPFWKKYQFSFDSDNKLIYFYNKNGNFLDNNYQVDNNGYNNEEENSDNKTNELSNNKNIDDNNINIKNEKYYEIKVKKIVLFIILVLIFIFLFFIFVLIIKKILFKKGFALIRVKKANELNEDEYYEYSSQNINFDKNKKGNNKELEMQIQKEN